MNRKILVSIAVLLAASLTAPAQNVADLVISEVAPDGIVMDDFGRQSGYIEIYNTSQGTVNFGGCFLTDDKDNLKKSIIQKGYSQTKLGPCQTIIFYASGRGEDGILYTNFTLERGKTLYLISNDGRTVIDTIEIPEDLPAGMAVEKLPIDAKGLEMEQQSEPALPSPMMKNGNANAESGSQKMERTDPHGFVLAIVSVSVVFSALAVLWFLFWVLFERPAKKKSQPKKEKKSKKAKTGGADTEIAAAIAMAMDMESNGDVYAAIATAVHLYLNDAVHDYESLVITIKSAASSDWSGKTQTFRRMPR